MTEQDKVTVDDIIGIVKTEEQTNSVEEVRKLRGRETMAGKRFRFNGRTNCIEYDNESILLDSYGEDIEELLNELHEENDVLKQELKTKVVVNRQYEELQTLKKENEQLKKENNKLHQKIFEMRTNVALDRTEISRQSYTPKEFLDKIEKW